MSKTHQSNCECSPNLIKIRPSSSHDTIRVPIEVVFSDKCNKVTYAESVCLLSHDNRS